MSCSEGSPSPALWDIGQEDKSGEARLTLLKGMERSLLREGKLLTQIDRYRLRIRLPGGWL
jgi:hypothetical protein